MESMKKKYAKSAPVAVSWKPVSNSPKKWKAIVGFEFNRKTGIGVVVTCDIDMDFIKTNFRRYEMEEDDMGIYITHRNIKAYLNDDNFYRVRIKDIEYMEKTLKSLSAKTI